MSLWVAAELFGVLQSPARVQVSWTQGSENSVSTDGVIGYQRSGHFQENCGQSSTPAVRASLCGSMRTHTFMVLVLAGCTVLGKSFTFSETQLSHLWHASLTGCREDQGLHVKFTAPVW